MPMSKYNAAFGGSRGSAGKAMRAMQEHYGSEKGKQVFYAKVNKAKSEGGVKELSRPRKKK